MSDSVTEVADKILDIEVIADRLALRKFNMFVKKYNLQCNQPKLYYNTIKNNKGNYQYFLSYIEDLIEKIKSNKISSYTELTDFIYNMVKS
jgi:hypothetical protein